MTGGISRLPKLPLTQHFLSDVRKSGQGQAQQGLSPLAMPSPFPWLWFRWMVDGDSGNLVRNPLMRVTNQMTRQLAALRDSQSLPPFTRGWLSLITLAFRALGRKHTVSSPCEGIPMLCYKRKRPDAQISRHQNTPGVLCSGQVL